MLVNCPRCHKQFDPEANTRKNRGFDQVFHVCPECGLVMSDLDEIRHEENRRRSEEAQSKAAFQRRIRWYASITPAGSVFPEGRRIVSRVRENRDVVTETWILNKGCNLDGLVRFLYGHLDGMTVCRLRHSPYDRIEFSRSNDIERLCGALGPFRWIPVSRQVVISKSYMLWEISVGYDLPADRPEQQLK